jgi:hypothetical protein
MSDSLLTAQPVTSVSQVKVIDVKALSSTIRTAAPITPTAAITTVLPTVTPIGIISVPALSLPSIVSPPLSSNNKNFTDDSSLMYSLFRLHRIPVSDFSCALSAEILLHGRIYICTDCVCFYSNIFGIETKRCLPFSRFIQVKSRQSLLVLPLLEITIKTRKGQEKVLLFTSFFARSRDECFDLISQLHARYKLALMNPNPTSAVLDNTLVNERDEYESVAGGVLYKARSITASDDLTSPRSLTEMSTNDGILGTARRNADELAVEENEDRHNKNEATRLSSLFKSLDARSIPQTESNLIWQRLSKMTIVCDIILPVSVETFSALFVDDDASLSLRLAYEKYAMCKNVLLSPWTKTEESHSKEEQDDNVNDDDDVAGAVETSFDNIDLSNHNENSNLCSITRTLRMTMPVNGGPLIVKETAVEVVQRLIKFVTDKDTMFVIDSSATSFDVPCGDSFVTEETWLLMPPWINIPLDFISKNNIQLRDGSIQCRLISFVKLNFSKDIWLADVIKSKTLDATRAFMKSYSNGMIEHCYIKEKDKRLSLSKNSSVNVNRVLDSKIDSNSKQDIPCHTVQSQQNGIESVQDLLSPSKIKSLSRNELETLYSTIYRCNKEKEVLLIEEKLRQERMYSKSWSKCSIILNFLSLFVLVFAVVSFIRIEITVEQVLERILKQVLAEHKS